MGLGKSSLLLASVSSTGPLLTPASLLRRNLSAFQLTRAVRWDAVFHNHRPSGKAGTFQYEECSRTFREACVCTTHRKNGHQHSCPFGRFCCEERGKAHLASVIGGDVEIGAISAAFGNGDLFTVVNPTLAESTVSLGEKPLLFRGSIVVAGRKRPLRHLVACSQELADTTSDGKLLLVSSDDTFIWSSLVSHYGLPAAPEWGPWMLAELRSQKRIHALPGFGYEGVAITGTRNQLLALLSRGLRTRNLRFPSENGAVEWPRIQLAKHIS